jgi:hypothetical protein
VRTVTAGLLAAGLLAAPVATAAGPNKPACDQVKDARGDVLVTEPGVDNGDYDITSADIATNKKLITVVIRLTSLAAEDPSSPMARDYEFDFSANGHAFDLSASLLTGGADFRAAVYDRSTPGGRVGSDLGRVTGIIDVRRHEIRMTAPLSLFAPYASFKQTYVDHLAVSSARAVGQDGVASPDGRVTVGSQSTAVVVDDASSQARYMPGARTCVSIGH